MDEAHLDKLIEVSVIEGHLADGVSPRVTAARTCLGSGAVAILAAKNIASNKIKNPPWTKDEDTFLRASLGILSEESIAEALGRTTVAVHLRWKRDLRLPAPSKNPAIITANQAANGMGTDAKSVTRLIHAGILPAYLLPSNDVTRVIERNTLLRFLVNPMNWVYFRPERVGLPCPTNRAPSVYDKEFWSYARRLVLKKRALWNDKWLRIGEVARMHGVKIGSVNQAIRRGKIKATDWGNYWILRSVATEPSVRFLKKGVSHTLVTDNAKAFLILAHAVGLEYAQIAALMKWKPKAAAYAMSCIIKNKQAQAVIDSYRLPVLIDRRSGRLCADWKQHKRRFPTLAKAMKELSKRHRNRTEANYYGRVMAKAEQYNNLKILTNMPNKDREPRHCKTAAGKQLPANKPATQNHHTAKKQCKPSWQTRRTKMKKQPTCPGIRTASEKAQHGKTQ